MYYIIRFNFLSGIILFSLILNVSAVQPSYQEITPTLKCVLVSSDSVIFNSEGSNALSASNRQDIVLNYRSNNITFELQPSDSIDYSWKDLTKNGVAGNVLILKSIPTFLQGNTFLK
jgi:hypothetical protein